jgi:hypothetical protein
MTVYASALGGGNPNPPAGGRGQAGRAGGAGQAGRAGAAGQDAAPRTPNPGTGTGPLAEAAQKQHPSIQAIDISDLAHPKLIATWDLSDEPGMPKSGTHDLDVNDAGTRAYTNTGWTIDGVRHQGLTILDTTEVQERKPNPKIHRVSSFNWGPPENFGGTHSSQLVTIKGRQYVICEDETMGANAAAPWGWARIVDVTD